MSDQVCYLCSELIAENPSKDHVVPKQAIKRAQPRAKGYDYAGTIPTHDDCKKITVSVQRHDTTLLGACPRHSSRRG